MWKAIAALIVTFIIGCYGIVVGHELLGGVIAIAVMGAFIIYFNDKKK